MQADRTPLRWLAFNVMAVLMAIAASALSHHGTAYQLYAFIGLSLAGAGLLAWLALDSAFAKLTLPQVLATAVAVAGVALFGTPLLEDDHYRYLWDGYITATTGKPYAHAPSVYFDDNTVALAMRDVLSGINNPELPTIYGPVLQAMFALCYWLAPAALWPFKLILLGALVAVLCLLRNAGVAPRWLMVFVLHPLVFKESALTAHPDILLGLVFLAAVLAWQRGWHGRAAALVSAAVAMKLSALVVLPLLCMDRSGRVSLRACLAMGLTLAVTYTPVGWSFSGAEWRALTAFSGQWTFNPLLFKPLNALLGDAPARLTVLLVFAIVWWFAFLQWMTKLRFIQRNPYTTPTDDVPLPPLVPVLVALLLLSPVVNPWYWLWVLPLALLRFSLVSWTMASMSLLAYAHVGTQVFSGSSVTTFAVPLWASALQLLAMAACLSPAFVQKAWRAP